MQIKVAGLGIGEITVQTGISVEFPGGEMPGLILAVSQASRIDPHKEFILNYLLHFLRLKSGGKKNEGGQ